MKRLNTTRHNTTQHHEILPGDERVSGLVEEITHTNTQGAHQPNGVAHQLQGSTNVRTVTQLITQTEQYTQQYSDTNHVISTSESHKYVVNR